ncbi:hypothetical protein D3C80_1648000 [compost metagenome]
MSRLKRFFQLLFPDPQLLFVDLLFGIQFLLHRFDSALLELDLHSPCNPLKDQFRQLKMELNQSEQRFDIEFHTVILADSV